MKFSIRDVMLVTVIVAPAVAWWLDHRISVAESCRLVEEVERLQAVDGNGSDC